HGRSLERQRPNRRRALRHRQDVGGPALVHSGGLTYGQAATILRIGCFPCRASGSRPRRSSMLAVLKWLFYLIAAIALIVVVGSFFLPAQAMVSRSTDIAAPPEKIFAIVGDLRRFNEFSPWAELDPGTKYTFEGPVSGIGQQMNWTSQNTDIGSGSQTIVAHEPPNFVETQLDFGTRGKSVARFDLVPSTSGTNVTWTFSSDLDGSPAKWFGLTLDRRIGADYEKGLFKLKTI